MITEPIRRLLDAGPLGHLVTLDPSGTPYVTLAWVGEEDGELVVATLAEQRKLRNMRADPRVVLSFETGRRNAMGLDEYLVVYGTARVTAGGAPALLQRLARVYLGPEVTFPPMPDPPEGFVTRIAVDRVSGVGAWD